MAARRGDPSFGLTLAQTSLVRPLGLFGHMVWLSGTVRDALTRAVRFYALVTRRTTLTLEERGAIVALKQHAAPGVVRGAILTELAFGSLALRARSATADRFRIRAVQFEHAGTASRAYLDVFGVPVTFGAAVDEMQLDAAQLDLPLATADAITSAALETRAAELTAADHSPFVDRVRRAVASNLESPISLVAIARELGTSARSLRRHLEQERQSLRAIVDDVRRERTEALLAEGLAMKDIAFRIGFSEPSALSRAYKRWTGKPRAGPRVK